MKDKAGRLPRQRSGPMRRYGSVLLRGSVSLLLLWLLLRKVEWSALGLLLGRLDALLAIEASLLTLLMILLLAVRWTIFLRQQEIPCGFLTVLSLTWAGQFFNSLLPGSTGGDAVKIYNLCRLFPHRKAAAAATVLADRLSALLALVVLAMAATLLEPVPVRLAREQGLSLPAIAMTAVGALIVVCIAGWLAVRAVRRSKWAARVGGVVATARRAASLNLKLLMACALAFALHLLNFLIFYLFARALHVQITYGQTLLIMPVVLLLVMAPITINGHGLREVLLITYFGGMGITVTGAPAAGLQEIVIALSLLLVSNDLLWSLPGGLWYMARGWRTPPAETQQLPQGNETAVIAE